MRPHRLPRFPLTRTYQRELFLLPASTSTPWAPANVRAMAGTESRRTSRVQALDGLRGITIVLVVLTHVWILYPKDVLERIPLLRGLFHGGSVTMFFVIGGFVVTQNLLRDRADGVLDPFRFYVRRVVRIGVQLVPLSIAILVLHRFDATDTATDATTHRSLLRVLTYTWNTYLVDNALEARADLGHLWYLSVQQQVYLLLPLAVLLFAGSRPLFAMCVGSAAGAVVLWRYDVLEKDGLWPASLLTTTRADALLLGVLVAVLLPRLHGLVRPARWLTPLSLVVLGVLVLLSPELPDDQYLREWGLAFAVVCAVLIATLARTAGEPPDPVTADDAGVERTDAHHGSNRVPVSAAPTSRTASPSVRLLEHPALQWLGNASLSIYIWHYPLFWGVSRHTQGWSPFLRVLVTAALLCVIVAAAQRFIEEPTQRWLRRSPLVRTPRPADEVLGTARST